MKTFKKLSHQFAHRKMGAFFRYNKEGEKMLEEWSKDVRALEEQVRQEWGSLSNAALIQRKMGTQMDLLRSQMSQLLEINNADYLRELTRIAASLGGRIEGHRVYFPDGSDANMPSKLTYQNPELR